MEWLGRLLAYLESNVDLVCSFIRTEMPAVRMERPEATFLCWLDFSEYGITDEEPVSYTHLSYIRTMSRPFWIISAAAVPRCSRCAVPLRME